MKTRYILALFVTIIFSMVSSVAYAAEDAAAIDSQIKKRQVDLENYQKAKGNLEELLDPDNHYIFFQRKGWVVPVVLDPDKVNDVMWKYVFTQAVIAQRHPDPGKAYNDMIHDLWVLDAESNAIKYKLKQDLATIKKNMALVEEDIQRLMERRLAGPELLQRIIGRWRWFNKLTVEFADGEMSATDDDGKTVNSGSYEVIDSIKRKFELHWVNGNWTDTLTLSDDGNHLSGHNQKDASVWADKIK